MKKRLERVDVVFTLLDGIWTPALFVRWEPWLIILGLDFFAWGLSLEFSLTRKDVPVETEVS